MTEEERAREQLTQKLAAAKTILTLLPERTEEQLTNLIMAQVILYFDLVPELALEDWRKIAERLSSMAVPITFMTASALNLLAKETTQ